MYEILLERHAERDLKRLPADVFRRVLKAIQALAEEPRPKGCMKLTGSQKPTSASAGDDHKAILWNPDTGNKLHEWLLPGPVHCVAFAPDGRHLATGNSNGTISIFRLTELRKKWQAAEK